MTRPKTAPQRIYVLGAGKVGRALAGGLRAAGQRVTLRPLRRGMPMKGIDADLLVLALRDGQLETAATALADHGAARGVAAVHCAGSLGPGALASLRAAGSAVGQMHPLVSFADARRPPPLKGAFMHVDGDARACQQARRASRSLGMKPVTIAGLDVSLYHAAAALLAGGAAALAAASTDALERAGAPAKVSGPMLAALLASVAHNLTAVGLPNALTGPVRRGDCRAVGAHLERLSAASPEAARLYRALSRAQLPLARSLREASEKDLSTLAELLDGRGD